MASSVPSLQDNALVADAAFGAYRIVRPLGSGSFGAVYEALQMPLGKRVALKVMHGHVAEQAEPVQRFRREAQALVRLRHPHVVDVLDLGEVDGRPFLAMEFLEGETLSARIARTGPMSLSMVAELMVPVCVAVAAAHDIEIIHRDLKPDNIFIAHAMGADHPKLLDFGIAKLALPDAGFAGTATAALLGTPFYMAPEQVQSTRSVGPLADTWSLAVIVWECLTGRRPFAGGTLFEVLQQVVALPLPPIVSLRPDVPAPVAAALQAALDRDPARRLPSARHLGLALLTMAGERTRSTFTAPLQTTSPVAAPRGVGETLAMSTASIPLALGTERVIGVEISALRAPAQGRRAPWSLGGAALLVGTLASTLFVFHRGGPPDAAERTVTNPRSTSGFLTNATREVNKRLQTRAAPPRSVVVVALEATPSTAIIHLDGVRVGVGRVRVEASREVPHQLRIEAPGFVPQTLSFREVPPPSSVSLESAPTQVAPVDEMTRARPQHPSRPHASESPQRYRWSAEVPPTPPPSAPPAAPPASSAVQHRSGTLNPGEF